MNFLLALLRAATLVGALSLPGLAMAQDAPAEARPRIDPGAMAILMKMAENIAAMPKFSAHIRAGYDVVQDSGQKIEFAESRTVTLKRPDRFRSDIVRSDGDQGVVTFNGKDLVTYNSTDNVYAMETKAGTVDAAITYFLTELKMRLPLAMLFVSTLPAELDRRVTDAVLVEESVAGKEKLDHIAARTETVDFQVWVRRDKALPRRIVLTYKQADGAPQYWADFSDWNMAPDVAEAQFNFAPPKGAERILFATQLQPPGMTRGKAEDTK